MMDFTRLLKKVDHVSLTVPDLDRAIAFYTDVFGARLAYRMGPFDAAALPLMEDGRDWTEAHINVPGAALEIAMLRLSPEISMELFEYRKPKDAVRTPPRNCDAGSRHVCFEVTDVAAAIKYLEQHDCRAMAGPIDMRDGPCPPAKSWYVMDPFGNQLELVEYV